MSTTLSKIPPGVQYIFDSEVRVRQWVERRVMDTFAGWSYSQIILPIFDYADLFELGMGKEQAEMTYRFTGRDGRLLALRPEMTSLVARTVAARFGNRKRPIRLSYSGEVFRWDEPRGGRQYEFHQIGLERIGPGKLEADTEVLVVAREALSRVGLTEFTITLSQVDFFNGIAEQLRLDEGDRRQMRDMIDRKEAARLESFLEKHAAPATRAGFSRLTALAGKREVISEARSLVSNPKSIAALDDIERVYQICEAIGIDANVDIDLGDVAGLDYYTGLTFKIYARGLGRALGRGGRYDQLLAKFGRPEPAVGFSICLDWLAGLVPAEVARAEAEQPAEIEQLDAEADIVSAFKHANNLRAAGRKVEIV
jgi:ATP phosphoribosyltransferase regulatory subunit